MLEPKRVNFTPRWPVTLDRAAEAALAETPFTGSLPAESPRIDSRITPHDRGSRLSLRSLSVVADLTQKLADYAGCDLIHGLNPDFSDLRSLSAEVSQFTRLTSEPFAEGSFIIPARLESDPFALSEPEGKKLIETDAVAERFGEILARVDKDSTPTTVSIGALQTLASLKRTLNREASLIEFSTLDRFHKPLSRFAIDPSYLVKVERAIQQRRPSQETLEPIEGLVTALDVVQGRLRLSLKDGDARVTGSFSRMLTPALLDSLNRRLKLQGVIQRKGGRPLSIQVENVEMLDPE